MSTNYANQVNTLASLQSQLDKMKDTLNTTVQSQVGTNVIPHHLAPNITALVKETVAAEISKLRTSVPEATTSQVQQQMAYQNPFAGVLPILGAALTEEQQLWLSQSTNLIGLPGFLMSKAGKELIRMAVTEYQSFCGD